MFVQKLHILLLLSVAFTGCKSVSSTMLHRSEANDSWEKTKKTGGVPITLKVPTHLRVDILELQYVTLIKGKVKRIPSMKKPHHLHRVEYSFIKTDKVFFVDLKRPAAGTAKSTMALDQNTQYFTTITNKVTDETITRSAELLGALVPGLLGTAQMAGGEGNGEESEIQKQIKEISSVVATEVFEIDAPYFEMCVSEFLDKHLNCCHNCSSPDIEPDDLTDEEKKKREAMINPPAENQTGNEKSGASPKLPNGSKPASASSWQFELKGSVSPSTGAATRGRAEAIEGALERPDE